VHCQTLSDSVDSRPKVLELLPNYKKERSVPMKSISGLCVLLFATTIHAQALNPRTDALKTNDATVRLAPYQLVQKWLYPNTLPPEGMVWVPRGEWWHAKELNSCEWCGKPMTFKHAAFDKKMTAEFLLETVLTIADVETGQSCLKSGRCKEGNPLLGRGSRPMQYGIRIPLIGVMWINSAWARKGNERLHIGGLRHWYIAPLIMHAIAIVGITSGIRH
jgi:hypothetical protein